MDRVRYFLAVPFLIVGVAFNMAADFIGGRGFIEDMDDIFGDVDD